MLDKCLSKINQAFPRRNLYLGTTLLHWGIEQTRDFGEIVFNLVAADLMSKTEQDQIEDFIDVYQFEDEFDWKKRKADLKRLP